MRDKRGGGGPKRWRICVTSFMDGPQVHVDKKRLEILGMDGKMFVIPRSQANFSKLHVFFSNGDLPNNRSPLHRARERGSERASEGAALLKDLVSPTTSDPLCNLPPRQQTLGTEEEEWHWSIFKLNSLRRE